MNDRKTKKELRAAYEARTVTGGVYIIRNTHSGQIFLEATGDLNGSKNRFEFAKKTGGGLPYKLQKDWTHLGASFFEFEVLESLEKGETQSGESFLEDLEVLSEYWREKLKDAFFY